MKILTQQNGKLLCEAEEKGKRDTLPPEDMLITIKINMYWTCERCMESIETDWPDLSKLLTRKVCDVLNS